MDCGEGTDGGRGHGTGCVGDPDRDGVDGGGVGVVWELGVHY